MARYIDLEELVKRINDNIKPENLEEKALIEWCKDECIRQGYAMPIADVVPKSEVEELIAEFDKMVDLISAMTGLNVLAYGGKFAELKKKYTEDKKDDNKN